MYKQIIHMRIFNLFHVSFLLPILGQALSGYHLFQEHFVPTFRRPTLVATRKLIRPDNCLPAIALNLAGACIVAGPTAVTTKPFLASVAITQSIMASSMVINDIIDLPVDRINNPTRPLVVGDVSTRYATGLATGLLILAELLNFLYIPKNLQHVTHLSALLAILYTPIFKRILFVKNLSCAALVSSSVLFSGFTVAHNIIHVPTRAFSTLFVACRMIFLGSLCTEILMDMCDSEGDAVQGIYTLPVLFGNDAAWQIAYSSMYLNVITNSMDIVRIHGLWRGFGLLFICSPLLHKLRQVKDSEYTQSSIKYFCKKTTLPMLLSLVYLAGNPWQGTKVPLLPLLHI
jgi:geranylgeranylglycerol-phosphate geranylgeranyltransferase